MAFLDISEVLLDPDFMDNDLVCERNKETVNEQGLAVVTTEEIPFSGVVTTNEGTKLQRAIDLERISGSITIHSIFPLTDGKDGTTADIVQWENKRYTVVNAYSYAHFGSGFTKAICNIIPVTG